MNLIKALIGNDEVKHKMTTQLKVHEDVIQALMRHFSEPAVALAALRFEPEIIEDSIFLDP